MKTSTMVAYLHTLDTTGVAHGAKTKAPVTH